MRDVTAGLDREIEIFRRALPPADKHLRRGQPVEGIVELDSPKACGVVLQLLPGRQAGGVKHTLAPMGVHIPGCADPDSCRLSSSHECCCSISVYELNLRTSPALRFVGGVSRITAANAGQVKWWPAGCGARREPRGTVPGEV